MLLGHVVPLSGTCLHLAQNSLNQGTCLCGRTKPRNTACFFFSFLFSTVKYLDQISRFFFPFVFEQKTRSTGKEEEAEKEEQKTKEEKQRQAEEEETVAQE